jgi:4-hydroxybenzoate polyprenyltransferase
MKITLFIGLIRLMRPKQWIKNAFVFAPLLFTGEFLDHASFIKTCIAAGLFCIASSAVYIVNDMHDIGHDRKHPHKAKKRPLASGLVPISGAIALLLILYGLLFYGYFIEPKVIDIIVVYILLNVAYTFSLKHQPVVDIFCIAIGFVLRVYAGATALTVPVSSWMFVTTLCLALYLAAIKRRQELLNSGSESRKVLAHYSVALVDRYAQMAAIGALLFYSLFVMATRPHMVLTIPIVLYGLFRYWYMVEALDQGESPTDALLSDWQLMLTAIIWVGICAWALQ